MARIKLPAFGVIFLCFCCPLAQARRPANIKGLTPSQLREYLEKLGQKGGFQELKSIASSDYMYSFLASSVVVKYLPTEKAIAYCDQLKFGSGTWQGAFFTLVQHPKAKVMPYLAKVYNKGDYGKVFCYEICTREKWPDFVEQAQKDILEYSVPILFPNNNPATVADYARNYLSAISKKNELQ